MASRETVNDHSTDEHDQSDAQLLIEELKVLREELKAQNEDLRRARLELEESKKEQAEFYQLSPIGYITIDRSLKIVDGNEAVAKLFDIDTKYLIHSHITRFVPHESMIHFMEHLDLASKHGTHSVDLRLGRSDAASFIAHLITYVVSNEGVLNYRIIVEDITERNRAEEKQQTILERFYRILSSMPYGVLLVTNEDRIESVNQAFCDIFSLKESPSDLSNLSANEMIEKIRLSYLDPNTAVARIEEIVSLGQPVMGEDIGMRGGRVLLRDFIPIRIGGRQYGRVWVHIDVTERKKAEEALGKNLAVLARSQEIGHLGSWSLDFDTGEFEASDEAHRVYGLMPGTTATLDRILTLIHPDDLEMYREYVESVRQEGRLGSIDFRIVWPDGSLCYVHAVTDSVVRSPNGRVTMASGITQDITERKKSEEAIEKERARLQAILNSLPVGVWIADSDDKMVMINDSAREIWGGEAPNAESVDEYEAYKAWSADTRERIKAEDMPLANALRGEVVRDRVVDIERFDGKRGTQLVSASPILDKNGKIIGGIAIAQDITEMRGLELELKRSNEELQQFAYIASHDLREPLRMISSFLDLLEEKYDGKVLDEKAKEYIEYAVDGAGRMQQLINDILTYSRVETRGKAFSRADINDVLDTALKDLRKSIEESGASITRDPLPSIMADKSQMVLLFENLIGNAIKFRDVEAPQVHVSAQRKWNEWIFSVKDNGIGIPKEQQDRIFEMFQRLHTREEYDGTGIGLAVAKKIVEKHGGRIWVESEEGRGATFYFTIAR